MSSDKKSDEEAPPLPSKADNDAVREINRAFSELARLMAQEPVDRVEHLSLIAMGEWADGEREPEFLDRQLEGSWKEHYGQCAKCRKNVAFYRAEAKRRGGTP